MSNYSNTSKYSNNNYYINNSNNNNYYYYYLKSNIQYIKRYEFSGLIMMYTIITGDTQCRNISIIQIIQIQ